MRAGMRNLPVKIYNKLQLGVEYVQFGHFSPKWPKNAHFQASEGQFPARNWWFWGKYYTLNRSYSKITNIRPSGPIIAIYAS